MRSFVLSRLLWMIPTLFGITLVVFIAVHAAPGDPATIQFGSIEGADPGADIGAARERFREEHLLDAPLWKQYLQFLGPINLGRDGPRWLGGTGREPWSGVLALDLGHEFQRPDVTVAAELGRRLCVTVPLALAAVLLVYLIAVPLGVLSAARRGSFADRAASSALFVLYSVPAFWAGLLSISFFGAQGLGWLPVLGLHDKDAAQLSSLAYVWDTLRHCVLPIATLSIGGLAYLSRQMRASLLEVIRQDFIRAARARGLSERTIVWKHALRNASLPVITLFASVLPALIGGSVVVETIFGIPGMGRYAYEGLLQRDSNVIMATTTLAAVMTLAGILVSDVLYTLVDPRIRHG